VGQVHNVLDKMAQFSNRLRSGSGKDTLASASATSLTLGSGGSTWEPVMAYEALKHYSDRTMTFGSFLMLTATDFAEAVQDVDPSETLSLSRQKPSQHWRQ